MDDYIKNLTAKRDAARKRVNEGRAVKALKDNAPALFELIDTEISLALNRMTQPTPLSDRDYLAAHGEIKALQRIRSVLEAREVEEVAQAEQAKILDEQLSDAAKAAKS